MAGSRSLLQVSDSPVYEALAGEERRQRSGIELIPSENYTYPEVLELLGSVFTNKYSEGYPGARYYGGQQYTDAAETLARERALALFGGDHANVQPLSGSAMNQAVYLGLLEPGDTILAMDLSHGGHLTHGAPVSHMGRLFRFVRYKTGPGGELDFDAIAGLAKRHRPRMIICGHSSYPLELDYDAFKRIADSVGAFTLADVSHIGGLIAGRAMANPMDAGFDVLTTTTHKSLRGPRGGLIVCRQATARRIDASVFPGLQGGPHMNQVAAVAVTLKKAAEAPFRGYCRQILVNAKALADGLMQHGLALVCNGTANHLMVVDTMAGFGIDGREAQQVLDRAGITVNKQVIPDDALPPSRGSGIRLGTPAATTRGMDEAGMRRIADWIVDAIRHRAEPARLRAIERAVRDFCLQYPVPGLD